MVSYKCIRYSDLEICRSERKHNKVIIKHIYSDVAAGEYRERAHRLGDLGGSAVKQKCSQCFPPPPLTFYYNLLSQSCLAPLKVRRKISTRKFCQFPKCSRQPARPGPGCKIFLNHCQAAKRSLFSQMSEYLQCCLVQSHLFISHQSTVWPRET